MKKINRILPVLCLAAGIFLSTECFASEIHIYDDADLLTAEEESGLEAQIERMHESWDMNFLAVTTEDASGKSSMEYADDFYDAKYPEASEEDGILYLIDMDHREIYLSTSGEAIRYLTDARIERILDEAYEAVAEGDYYGTFQAFLDATEDYLSQGIPSDQYHYDVETGERDEYHAPVSAQSPKITVTEAVIALVAALLAAGGTCGVIVGKYQLKFEDFHYDAYTDAEVRLWVNEDRLINSFITHRKIPQNNGNSGGGGSRSSVHHSSSGRSHGGGGRGF